MTTLDRSTRLPAQRLEKQQIEDRLRGCPCLPSLGCVDSALKELLNSDNSFTSQIAEVVRRDPSLTARLLRLVNAVHYGFARPVRSVDEAVFYLGVRQIRQLAMVTPIIEDFQVLASRTKLEWRGFWRHCIATAVMTKGIMEVVHAPDKAETDYVAGLIHDVGKIAMASAFPDHFAEIYIQRTEAEMDLMDLERDVLGMDHAELGALYLEKQFLPDNFIEVVRYHHQPEAAPNQTIAAAAVQVGDSMVQQAKIGFSGRLPTKEPELWRKTAGWNILFGNQNEVELAASQADMQRTLRRIPATLDRLL